MKQVTETGTPISHGLVAEAAKGAAFGDGQLLAQIMELMKQLLPFIMTCFPAKAAFVEAAHDPTWFQQARLVMLARRQARAMGVPFRDRAAVAESAANLMLTTAATTSPDRLEACYVEMN